jgi:hypothetical protein
MRDGDCVATGLPRLTRKQAAVRARRLLYQLTGRRRTFHHCRACGSWHVVKA